MTIHGALMKVEALLLFVDEMMKNVYNMINICPKRMYFIFLLFISGNFISMNQGLTYEKSQEEILLEHLFDQGRDLNKIIPKINYSDTDALEIAFNFTIFNVYNIRASDGEIDMTLKISMKWQNELVKWNSTVSAIERLPVDSRRVWTPKLVVNENALGQSIGADENETVYLYKDGLNSISIFKRIKIVCEINTCTFPLDGNDCSLTFLATSYNASILKLRPNFFNKTIKQTNQTETWYINTGKPTESLVEYDDMDDEYASALVYKIRIQRRALYFLATTIVPMFLLSIISSSASILPAMTGDRIALLITCLLAFVVYLDTIFRYLPESSATFPIIFIWTLVNLAFITLQIIIATICLNWANKEKKKKKPGKKAIFIIFYFIRYVILFLPIIYNKIKECREKRRKRRVSVVDENQESTVQEIAHENNHTNEEPANTKSDEKTEMRTEEQKSFKNAVKLIDHFAMLLSLVSIGTIVAAVMLIVKRKHSSLCDLGSDLGREMNTAGF